MRKLTLSLMALLCHYMSNSQNVFPSYGRVGVGTNSPIAEFHIVTGNWNKFQIDGLNTAGLDRIVIKSSSNDLFFGAAGSDYGTFGHVKTSGSYYSFNGVGGISIAAVNTAGHLRFYAGGQLDQHERLRIDNSGKMYAFGVTKGASQRDSVITMDPTTRELQLTPMAIRRILPQDTRAVATVPADYNSSFQVQLKNNTAIGLMNEGSGLVSTIGVRSGAADNTGKSHELAFSDNNNLWIRSGFTAAWGAWKKVILDSAGIVNMGTTANRATLNVNGEIAARKVKVTQSNWPDYVFEWNYNLLPLSELEEFIRKYKHLPDVPSAKEVAENGVELGDNQAVLLKKIEELTLYTIQQQKIIEEQAKQIEQIKTSLDKLITDKL